MGRHSPTDGQTDRQAGDSNGPTDIPHRQVDRHVLLVFLKPFLLHWSHNHGRPKHLSLAHHFSRIPRKSGRNVSSLPVCAVINHCMLKEHDLFLEASLTGRPWKWRSPFWAVNGALSKTYQDSKTHVWKSGNLRDPEQKKSGSRENE